MIRNVYRLVVKEFLHLVRDRRTLAFVLFMPTILTVIFGYAIGNPRVTSIRTRVLDMDGGRIATRSEEPNNPALKLEVTHGEKTTPVWVFANYPQFNTAPKLPVRFGIQDLRLGSFTGLQVTNQPGQWLVWLGSTVLAFGFVWAFFFAHRQFWALELPAAGGKSIVLMSGMTSKQHEEFRDEFKELIDSLKEN